MGIYSYCHVIKGLTYCKNDLQGFIVPFNMNYGQQCENKIQLLQSKPMKVHCNVLQLSESFYQNID